MQSWVTEFPTICDKSQTAPCTRVDDVGEVELEVAGAAGADVDGAAGAEALRAAAEDEAAAGVTLRPADTHALGLGYIKNQDIVHHSHILVALTLVSLTVHSSLGKLVTWNTLNILPRPPVLLWVPKLSPAPSTSITTITSSRNMVLVLGLVLFLFKLSGKSHKCHKIAPIGTKSDVLCPRSPGAAPSGGVISPAACAADM